MANPFRVTSVTRAVPPVAHRRSWRAFRAAAAMLAAAAVLTIAGCTSQDGLAATANNGTGSTSVDERIVEILPLLTANDQLVAFASNQTSGTSAWYRISIDSNGSVSKPEKLADRLAAYQAWSALASLNNN